MMETNNQNQEAVMRNRITFFAASIIILLVNLIPATLYAQETAPATSFDQLKYLLGEWVGEGGGDPGQGTGGFSFNLDLQGKIMVRRNYADYPATDDKPASRHDDLMIIYQENPSLPLKAAYFDSEGHVINYNVEISTDQVTIVFITDLSAPGPRFRLSYSKTDDNNLGIKFEMSPPGQPDSFSPYIVASAHRKQD